MDGFVNNGAQKLCFGRHRGMVVHIEYDEGSDNSVDSDAGATSDEDWANAPLIVNGFEGF